MAVVSFWIHVAEEVDKKVGADFNWIARQAFGVGGEEEIAFDVGGKIVYVSAAADTAEEAMNAAAYHSNSNSKLAVFFCPKQVSEDLSLWKKPRISNSTNDLIEELSNLLQQNQKRSVSWHVEGEGAAVLARAITKISGNLEKHSFKFINARTNLVSLLHDLGQRKAQLKGEFLDYTRDRTALLSLAKNPDLLSDQLKKLPIQAGYDRISRRYLIDHFRALAENGNAKAILAKAISLKGSSATFLDAVRLSRGGFK